MFVTIKNPDLEQFFKLPKLHLIFAGYWPLASLDSKWAKIYYYYATFLIFPMIAVLCFSIFINIFFNLDSIEKAADAIYILASNFNFFLKYLSFALKMRHFKEFLISMDNRLFQTFEKKHFEIVKNWRDFSYKYIKYFFYCIYVCVGFFAIFPFLDKNGNQMPIGGYVPFDIQNSTRNYALAYTFQMIATVYTVCLNMSIDLLPSIFMNIGCAQVEILKDNLRNAIVNSEERVRFRRNRISITHFDDVIMNENKDENEIYVPLTEDVEKELHKILKHCVKHHDAINRLFRKIEQVFNPGMLVLFVFDGIAICVTFLQLLMIPLKSFKYLTVIQYLIAITVQIGLYCWNGHHVIVQSSTIGDSCYEMEWFRCSTKMKKEIRIIIERCKRPVKLSAGGIFELSVTSLTQILRTSYQYFNVLRTVYTK